MKLTVCFAILGFVALSLAEENVCPDDFRSKMKSAKEECISELGIEWGPKAGGQHKGGQIKGGQRDGGQSKGGQREVGQSKGGQREVGQRGGGPTPVKGGSIEFSAGGLRKNVAPLVRMVRQISETLSNKQNRTERSNENMKKLAECVDGKLKDDTFYQKQKSDCENEPENSAEGGEKGNKCLYRKLKKACGNDKKGGRSGSRPESANGGRSGSRKGSGNGGLEVNFKKGAVVANETSMALNATQLNVTTPLIPTLAPLA